MFFYLNTHVLSYDLTENFIEPCINFKAMLKSLPDMVKNIFNGKIDNFNA